MKENIKPTLELVPGYYLVRYCVDVFNLLINSINNLNT